MAGADDKPVSNTEHKEVADEIDAEYEKLLQTDPSIGLSDEEAAARLEKFGPNGNYC